MKKNKSYMFYRKCYNIVSTDYDVNVVKSLTLNVLFLKININYKYL